MSDPIEEEDQDVAHWPSKAVLAVRGEYGVVLWHEGTGIEFEADVCGLEARELGFLDDGAPEGFSIWEGEFEPEPDDDHPGLEITVPKGTYRALTDLEWAALRANISPFGDLSELLPHYLPGKVEGTISISVIPPPPSQPPPAPADVSDDLQRIVDLSAYILRQAGLYLSVTTTPMVRLHGGTEMETKGGIRGYVNPFVIRQTADGEFETTLPHPDALYSSHSVHASHPTLFHAVERILSHYSTLARGTRKE